MNGTIVCSGCKKNAFWVTLPDYLTAEEFAAETEKLLLENGWVLESRSFVKLPGETPNVLLCPECRLFYRDYRLN